MKSLSRLGAFLLIAAYISTLGAPMVALAQSTSISVTPSVGAPPLTVTFRVSATDSSDSSGIHYTIVFGDGAAGAFPLISAPTLKHTYASVGIYTAVITRRTQCSATECLGPSTTIGTLKVTVNTAATSGKFPTCNIFINPSVINPGGTATISWTSTNATAGAITNVGNVPPNGSKQISPPTAQLTTYFGSFTGAGGTANCQASVQVSYGTVGANGGVNDGTIVNPNPVNVGSATGFTNGTPASTPAGSKIGALVTCGTGGFVPGTPGSGTSGSDPNASTGCQACNLAQLVSNLINFAIGISIPLAAGLFAWAGILYFTSGARPSNKENAKQIFSSAFIGFLLVITSWLIINTLLQALIRNSTTMPQQSWFTIQCDTGTRPVNESINSVLNSILSPVNTSPVYVPGVAISDGNGSAFGNSCPDGSTPSVTETGNFCNVNGKMVPAGTTGFSSGPGGSCPSGYIYKEDATQYWCQNPNNKDDWVETKGPDSYTVGNTPGLGGTAKWSDQLATACSEKGLSDCDIARAIMANECASGNPACKSSAGAIGLMQVMPTTACTLNSSIDGCDTCRVTNKQQNDNLNGNCSVVAQNIMEPSLNMSLGTQLLSRLSTKYNGDVTSIAAAYNGGDGANNYSTVCGGGTAWQCALNPGFAETRKYAPNVTATYNTIKIK